MLPTQYKLACFCALFGRLISHQPTVLFSQNEPATSNQPQPASSTFLSEQTGHQQPASSTFLSEQISTSHQPPAKRTVNEVVKWILSLICI
jgi:hypothetical protein